MEHPPDDRSSRLTVVATTPRATRAALHAAAELGQAGSLPLRLIVPLVVPFPAQLHEPPVPVPFIKRSYEALAAGENVETRVDVYLCRDARSVLLNTLAAESPVVMGLDGRGDLRAHRLARWLTARGHRVLLVGGEPGDDRSAATLTGWYHGVVSACRRRLHLATPAAEAGGRPHGEL